MKLLNQNRLSIGPRVALLLTVSVGAMTSPSLDAQPDPNNAPKAENPQNRKRAVKAKAPKRLGAKRQVNKGERRNGKGAQARTEKSLERDYQAIEAITGKPLTEEQKQKVKEAATARDAQLRAVEENYYQELAGITGITPAEMEFQIRRNRRNIIGKETEKQHQPPAAPAAAKTEAKPAANAPMD